ncbi:HIT-like domain-containing protein [Zychaea mexicana]|uniref:HIT-like domain-containing protein n=1 Tax=Zychaea mexicana TaxID=64656 RepID=UPI0022FF3F6E|nr:HIT-like domain-containing protein [Zychaea mexicana]KAI9489116.1 HIT-like domain-containing protein [Zychaea mexicana]
MSTHSHLTDNCIFCKIIRGEIPSFKLIETDKSFSFMDIDPLSPGHALVIPKYHAEFFHQVPDEYLADALPVAKKIAAASKLDQYNVLQNNGKLANQAVPHVHFHIIPKPTEEQGLGLRWKPIGMKMDKVKELYEEVKKDL